MSSRSIRLACGLTLLALVLTGCGSGSDDSGDEKAAPPATQSE